MRTQAPGSCLATQPLVNVAADSRGKGKTRRAVKPSSSTTRWERNVGRSKGVDGRRSVATRGDGNRRI